MAAIPAPTYEIDEEVFLIASAQIGFLESYKVNNVVWNPQNEVWQYIIDIKPKGPAPLITVGDRIDQRDYKRLVFKETELTTQCDALTTVESNLLRRLATVQTQIANLCPSS